MNGWETAAMRELMTPIVPRSECVANAEVAKGRKP
jgi:hypothetical protein